PAIVPVCPPDSVPPKNTLPEAPVTLPPSQVAAPIVIAQGADHVRVPTVDIVRDPPVPDGTIPPFPHDWKPIRCRGWSVAGGEPSAFVNSSGFLSVGAQVSSTCDERLNALSVLFWTVM